MAILLAMSDLQTASLVILGIISLVMFVPIIVSFFYRNRRKNIKETVEDESLKERRARNQRGECGECGVLFTDDNPHHAGGMCVFCWTRSH